MRWIAALLLALLLGAPAIQEGEAVMPVEVFIQRAGIEADGALRDKLAAFLSERGYTARIIGLMDPALARRYAENLDLDRPISYAGLLEEPSSPLPEDLSALRELAVLHPEGAVTASLLADFERGLVYYDDAWPVPMDVCRAAHAAALTPEAAKTLLDLLDRADLINWNEDYPGDAAAGLNVLALRFDSGVTRYTVAALSQAPDGVLDALLALLSAGAEAAGA